MSDIFNLSMNQRTINSIKKSVCKVHGVNRAYNFHQPYQLNDEYESGGTGFFVNPKHFGSEFKEKQNCRYLLTNFHVVSNYDQKSCLLEWPERNKSYLIADVLYVAPNLDVAILELNIGVPQVKWWSGDHVEWIESIKNCPLNTTDIIKGSSQKVKCIGFPNLQSDYQLSDGTLSSRGLGMLSCDLSINAGNSGGPLFLSNKVVGICTASVCDAERLALAVPIQEIFRFFQHYCQFTSQILRLPCWGMSLKNLSPEYMDFKNIDRAFNGVLIKSVIKNQSCCKAGLKKGDIIVGIETKDMKGNIIKYNVDTFGQVQFSSTDMRVSIDSVEFMLNLDPKYLILHVYRRKKLYTINVYLKPIDFKVRTRYPTYESISYTMIGGVCISELHLNMLTNKSDDEDEEEEECIFDHSVLNTLKKTSGMEAMCVITHIPPQSYVSFAANDLSEHDHITKINNIKISNMHQLSSLLDKIADDYYSNKNEKSNYIVIHTSNDEHVLSLDQISETERELNKSMLVSLPLRFLRKKKTKKRKRY